MHFWNHYKDQIKQKLFLELKDNLQYDKARELITINEMTINVDKQIPIFIDMLNKGNSAILKYVNKETLEGYPNIKLSYFWHILCLLNCHIFLFFLINLTNTIISYLL